jgi:hypothetical protein
MRCEECVGTAVCADMVRKGRTSDEGELEGRPDVGEVSRSGHAVFHDQSGQDLGKA